MKNYSAEDLQKNYDKFIEALGKVFSGERLEKLKFMYSQEELGTELVLAPASGKEHYHSAYVGGYLDHVMNVARNAYKMKKLYEEGGIKVDFTDEELFFAAFHHDLGKLGSKGKVHYVTNPSDWHVKNQGKIYDTNNKISRMAVPDRGLFTLQQLGITLTEEEYIGIKINDGIFDEANKFYNSTEYQEAHSILKGYAVRHHQTVDVKAKLLCIGR